MLDGMLDSHFISAYEQKFEHTSFARVDSNTIDKLIEKEDVKKESKLDDKQKEEVKKAFEEVIDKTHFNVEFSTLGEDEAPVEIIQNEWMRRYKEMNQMGGMPMWGDMPDNYTLMLNTNNAAIATLPDKTEDERKSVISQLYDLARLSKNLLKGKELNDFIKRNFNNIIN
jgi:molecular chaperone HtpG